MISSSIVDIFETSVHMDIDNVVVNNEVETFAGDNDLEHQQIFEEQPDFNKEIVANYHWEICPL